MLNEEYECQMQEMTDQDDFLLLNIETTSYPTYNLDNVDDVVFEEILREFFYSTNKAAFWTLSGHFTPFKLKSTLFYTPTMFIKSECSLLVYQFDVHQAVLFTNIFLNKSTIVLDSK